MPFYHYSQNNSGGSFDFNEKEGITNHVVIEGADSDQANRKAEEIGIYFDGCENGVDCACCGDRWSQAYGAGDHAPMVYSHKVEGITREELPSLWMGDRPVIAVHYIGRKFEFVNVLPNPEGSPGACAPVHPVVGRS